MVLLSLCNSCVLAALFAIALAPFGFADEKLTLPACSEGTKRVFFPGNSNPKWAACADGNGLLQGWMVQLSAQQEILRIAFLKNSKRNGKEIRVGLPSTLEEREYVDGHLNGRSYVFKAETILGRLLPKPMAADDWQQFSKPQPTSYLKALLKQEPLSTTEYKKGRLIFASDGKKTYHFNISPDGRIHAENHPEMKGLFFIDPEPLWSMNADDLKKALLPGFGSCKKYSAPIGRFTRHFDSLLYRRETNEKKHVAKLEKMIQKFIDYCVPKDLVAMMGVLECAPQMPSPRPSNFCKLAVSDQLSIPYQPKYFKFEFTLKKQPEEFLALLESKGLSAFLSSYDKDLLDIEVSPETSMQLKKTPRGLFFKTIEAKLKQKEGFTQDWWTWYRVPGQ